MVKWFGGRCSGGVVWCCREEEIFAEIYAVYECVSERDGLAGWGNEMEELERTWEAVLKLPC